MAARIEQWRDWMEETHSSNFELRRHFFKRFFDSELVATPGQWRVVAVGTLGIVASLGIVLGQAYFRKYRYLLALDSPEPYRNAMVADHLFFITLSMLLTGLLTALQWSSLFPGLRDYMALTGLPVKPRDLFAAKLTALLSFVGCFIVFMNVLPSMIIPGVAGGRYAESLGLSVFTLFFSSCLAGFCVFFVLVTLQGVLLNIVPISMAASVSLFVQGALMIAMLCCLPLALSIPGMAPHMAAPPAYAIYLPPAWFLGLDQYLLGRAEALVSLLANSAIVAISASITTTALAYIWSYKRHRIRIIESPIEARHEVAWIERWRAWISDHAITRAPEQGVFAFLVKTLSRSQQHRLVLTAFAGIAIAIILNVFVTLAVDQGFRGFRVRTQALQQAAVSVPQALALFLLAGFRYLFRLPVELRANWVFRVNEGGNRLLFLSAVERFLRWAVVIPVAVLTAPIELRLLGYPSGPAAILLSLMTSLLLMELMLFPLERIPFTSSYLPGQRPVVETLMIYMAGVAIYVYSVSGVIVWASDEIPYTMILFGLLLAGWAHIRKARVESWVIGRLEFEELEEPVIHTLNIDKD
jgi:hypothetical protein